MPQKYYQQYGPISRRRSEGRLNDDEEPPQRPERPERPKQPERRRSWLGPVFGVLLVVLVVVALPFAQRLFAADRPPAGVSVQGFSAAGMSRVGLQKALEDRYATFMQQPVTLVFEEQTWTPTLNDLGTTLDLAATAEAATEIGRRGDLGVRTGEILALWQGGVDVAPRLRIDQAVLQEYLAGLAGSIESPPRDAALSIAAGKVIPTPGVDGRQLLADSTAIDIVQALQSLSPQTVIIRTRLLPPTLGDQAVARAADDARLLLSQPIILRQGERSWTWDAEKIAQYLSIHSAQGVMTIGPDQTKLEKAVDDLSQLVDSPSAEPRVAFRNGALWITQEGQTGWRVKQPEAVGTISETLWLAKRDLALPVEEMQPQVTAASLPDLGIQEVVGEGQTSFAGSARYRVTNIKAGSARMDGVLIPPDAEFSFNTQLGEVDEANGFVEGYAVIGNRTQLEWGGGVCQDSTTLFRAAFWAGLPITERHAHPFYISWYDAYAFPDQAGAGMDATIYTGVSDFKFVNDTGHWLLLESVVDEANATLTMRLYGTKPNRTVSVIGPSTENVIDPPSEPRIINDASLPAGTFQQTDTARKGMDISVYRVISENGEQGEPELFFTRFKAWPNVFVRGTGQ